MAFINGDAAGKSAVGDHAAHMERPLNPRHRDALEVRIISVIREQFDNRLFRFGTR